MKESDPFRELLESLEKGEWLEREEADHPGGQESGGGFQGGYGGGMRQGSLRPLWWLVLPLLVIVFFNWGLGFYTDWLWYASLDLTSVFLTRYTAAIGLFLGGALVFWFFLALNVLLARRLEPRGLTQTPLSQIADALGIRVTPTVLIIGAVLAFFMGAAASTNWEDLLLYLNQIPFHLNDPIFGQDVSFFVFSLPIWQAARNWLMTVLVITLIATALVSGVGWRSWNTSAAVRAHLSGLGALILLLIAWQYRLDAYQLVYSNRGAVFGGGYTDVKAQLPAYNILTVVTLLTAILLLVNVYLRQAWRAIVVVLVVWVAAAFLAGNVYPGLVQRFQVDPNEFDREQPYIEQNIRFTRIAYDLDSIEDRNYEVTDAVTAGDLLVEPETIRNVRLWDYRPLLQTYSQIQALRQYYEFADVDVDRYVVNGEMRQVMLSARELTPERLSSQAQTWVNRKLVYTHGYGVAVSPVAQVTRDGLPEFLVKDLPPRGVMSVTQPQIYFGERTDDYVIVRTNTPEFDHPQGEGNAFTTFGADTGVNISGLLSRLAFALRFGDINILLTDAINSESQLLWKRNIVQRVREVAPFLRYDSDPYIVIGDDGKLYWLLDAYTASDRFPYSEPSQVSTNAIPTAINYIRNSAKVVIDAYSGVMRFYVVDTGEPIIAAYSQIFPALFSPWEDMPADLRDNIRYPTDLFSIQAAVFRTYHMTDPKEFYNREDMWAWPEEIFDSRSRLMEPYYVLMELPGRDELNFIQILPFTPANRENMIAWLAANSNPDRYGQKVVYRFGKDSLNFGPKQIESRIDQDPIISSQLSLWNQQGSQVIRGNLLVIPVGDGLLYVEPLYLQAAEGKIPELKRVILATSERVVMAENLGLALVDLFGRDVLADTSLAELTAGSEQALSAPDDVPAETPGPASVGTALEELIVEANARYQKAQGYLQQGDWAGYGAEMDALRDLLQRMIAVSGVEIAQPGPQPEEPGTSQAAPTPAAEPGS